MKEEPAAPKEEPVKKEIEDAPCLESFFNKTSAMPPLYWLPLNEEQAIERATAREAKVRTMSLPLPVRLLESESKIVPVAPRS